MLSKTLALKEQGFFIRSQKNRPSYFAFKGGLFLNRYNHKGQVKIPLYTQYMSVFENLTRALFVRVTVCWVNLFYILNIVIYIKIIVFL
jgi:hypothetical protein